MVGFFIIHPYFFHCQVFLIISIGYHRVITAVSDNILSLTNLYRASGFHLITGRVNLIGNIVDLCPSRIIPRQILPCAVPVIRAVQCDNVTRPCTSILKQSHLNRTLSGTTDPLFPHIDIREPGISDGHPIDA